MKPITAIKRADGNTKKDKLFSALSEQEKYDVLSQFVLSLPKDAYPLRRLNDLIFESLGMFAMFAADKRFFRGLAALNDKKIWCSFTHGLEEVTIK